MGKALESYRYGDPANVVDRIRSSEAASAKRKAKREAERENRAGLSQEEMKMIPAHWLTRK
jgi:hypothetical protein